MIARIEAHRGSAAELSERLAVESLCDAGRVDGAGRALSVFYGI